MERAPLVKQLLQHSFDVLVIGGGATGAGIALDSCLRGYKTALIEAADFSSGASSQSTKLLHGGVRYLQNAFLHLDWRQLQWVKDSLKERSTLMRIAPHLTNPLQIIIPFYRAFDKYYYWCGLKIYEKLAGSDSLGPTEVFSRDQITKCLPTLEQKSLSGGISYVDGQFDDARLNIALIQTALEKKCIAVNYMELKAFIKERGSVRRVLVEDNRTGFQGVVAASVVVNATGCFADRVRQMDQADAQPLLSPSQGTHIVLKKNTFPLKTGLLIPKTEDGRVLFALPWQGETLVGTTEAPASSLWDPKPTIPEIEFLLTHLQRYSAIPIGEKDIVAAWSGVRPLYKGKKGEQTSVLSRDHFIERSASNLYSVVGGKWTTYRLMARDLLDTVIADGSLPKRLPCSTAATGLAGSENFSDRLKNLLASEYGFSSALAEHLAGSYGDKAHLIAKYAKEGFSKKLHSDFPYIEAEVIYILRNELPCSTEDILSRRLRIRALDDKAANTVGKLIEEIRERLSEIS